MGASGLARTDSGVGELTTRDDVTVLGGTVDRVGQHQRRPGTDREEHWAADVLQPCELGLTNNPSRLFMSMGSVGLDTMTKALNGYGGGVARFDGTSWTRYRTDNSGLPARPAALRTPWTGVFGSARAPG